MVSAETRHRAQTDKYGGEQLHSGSSEGEIGRSWKEEDVLKNTCEELTRMPRTAICVYKIILLSLFVSVSLALALIHCSFFTYAPFVPHKIQAWQLRTLGPFGGNICSALAAFYKCTEPR